ncbi:SCO2400 family protein [Streptomyces siamensis]|uniref:Zinc ribbon domain-containing protein n=1 Tax=Streptomyces siamensis TaxID=1274986 RepID=A0ABP9J636_9ACTN
MDYCSSCRRHLNGALVCPGCGAYAPDIAPRTADGRIRLAPARTGGAPAATARRADTGAGTGAGAWYDSPSDDVVPYSPAAEADSMPPLQQGRAARRRQLARWKKNKRRAAVASAVALFGGGLTVAAMDRHSTDRTQAATAPDDPTMDVAQEQPPGQNRPPSTAAPEQDARRSSPAHSLPQPATTNAPRQQSLSATPRATLPIVRSDNTAPARPAAPSTPQPQSTAPAADSTAPDRPGTTTEQSSEPTTAHGTDSSGSQTSSPALISTSPTEICLLVVCLG